ncbi:TPA: sigma-70 family RNA polymerase sigma factor [Streptococcus suis]
MGKIQQKRELKIQKAAENNDWDKVLHLLEQPFENFDRKSRQYGLLSLNYVYKTGDGDSKELGDILPFETTPLDSLCQQELIEAMYAEIGKLPENKQMIIYGFHFEDKKYSHLAKEVGMSDKTVKKVHMEILALLREKLRDYK